MSGKKRWIYFLSLATLIAIGFNNCSPSFYSHRSGEESNAIFSSLSSGVCEDQLKNTFATTYHPFLTTNCSSCHISGGRGLGPFASADVNSAFSVFMSVGANKVNARAVDGGHQPPYTGPQNQAQIDSFKSSWAQAEKTYIACQVESATSGGGGGNTNPGGTATVGVVTLAKVVPTGTIAQALANTNWRKIEWDIEIEVPASEQGKYKLIGSIELKAFVQSGNILGYEFRNPSFRLKTGATVFWMLRGLDIYINDSLRTDITTYLNSEGIISGMSDYNLAPQSANAFAYLPTAKEGDRISVQIKSLTVYNGLASGGGSGGNAGGGGVTTPVTYTRLMAPGGVFATSCVGCHGNNNPRGNLNLQNFTQAQSRASLILSRMKSPVNPMPTSGQLPQGDIDTVQSWVDAGAPQ